jgi:hypothetical protein
MRGRAHKLNCALTGPKFISPSLASFGENASAVVATPTLWVLLELVSFLEASTWIVLNKSSSS